MKAPGALIPFVKNPFRRVLGALLLASGVIAVGLGVLYGGCILIMKTINS